jgi:hypothetical protein
MVGAVEKAMGRGLARGVLRSEDGKRAEARRRPFDWGRGEAGERGSEGGRRIESRNGEERGGHTRRGTARAARQRPAAARPWRGHVARPAEQAGKGLTGGPRPQCRAAAPVDRRARAAQCQAVRIQIGFKIFQTDSNLPQTLTDPNDAFPYSKNSK